MIFILLFKNKEYWELKRLICIALILVLSVSLVGCGENFSTRRSDFHGQYSFELPFDAVGRIRGHIWFTADYTLDEMRQFIEDAGYEATIHDFEEVRRIFITATRGAYKYYFVIWDVSDSFI